MADQPTVLKTEERMAIQHLAQDIPALWNAETTTTADRQLIEAFAPQSKEFMAAINVSSRTECIEGKAWVKSLCNTLVVCIGSPEK